MSHESSDVNGVFSNKSTFLGVCVGMFEGQQVPPDDRQRSASPTTKDLVKQPSVWLPSAVTMFRHTTNTGSLYHEGKEVEGGTRWVEDGGER